MPDQQSITAMIPAFLTYGAIGLGLALAGLSYLLVKNEKVDLRKTMVFFLFSIILLAFGFTSEWIKHFKNNDNLAVENDKLFSEINLFKEKELEFIRLKPKIDTLKEILKNAMRTKTGLVNGLDNLNNKKLLELIKDIDQQILNILN